MRSAYWEDRRAKDAFLRFLREIHGLDLGEWAARGFWDADFRPFSYFEGEEIVSSLCVYSLVAVVDGADARIAQFSSVGTAPRRRRRGLNRRLTEIALDWAKEVHDAILLFADEEAIPFYEACGFTGFQEYLEVLDAGSLKPRPGLVRLDPGRDGDLARIYRLAQRREPVSNRLGVTSERLLAFHALYPLRKRVHVIPDLDCLVIFERAGGTLKIYDVVAESMPDFETLYGYLADAGDRRIEFHFHADKLGLADTRREALAGNHPFALGAFPLEEPVFPYTCRA